MISNNIASILGLALLTAGLTACDGADRCGPSSGTVARVLDGDTIELESGEKIRYLMIDTPEVSGEIECFGEEAKQLNTELVAGKEITLRYDTECTDRFERLLAYVSVDGREINSLMVERGYACVLYIPPNGTERKNEFDSLESLAKQADKGLWAQCSVKPC